MKRVFRALLVLLVVLPLVALGVFAMQARNLSARLATEAQALDARRFQLPDGAPGSILDCLARQSDLGPDLSFALPLRGEAVQRAVNGGELDPATRDEAHRHDAWLANTLQCGALRDIAPTAGLGVFPDLLHRRRQTLPRAMDALASLAPISMREQLATGHPEQALDTCASVLTLTTAWLRLEGLESELATLGPSNTVMPVCRAAFVASAPEARARFSTRVQALLALVPDFSEVMRIERVQLSVRTWGAWIPTGIAAEFPEQARRSIDKQRAERWVRGVTATLALRVYWKQFDRGMRELELVSALPAPQRERDLERVQKTLEAPVLWRFLAAPPVDLKYQLYSPYLDHLRDSLTHLTDVP